MISSSNETLPPTLFEIANVLLLMIFTAHFLPWIVDIIYVVSADLFNLRMVNFKPSSQVLTVPENGQLSDKNWKSWRQFFILANWLSFPNSQSLVNGQRLKDSNTVVFRSDLWKFQHEIFQIS